VGTSGGGAKAAKKVSKSERARRIYRWVVENIEPGEERDPPKIITGKSGEPTMAYLYLCRLVGIDARLGLVRDRLSPPAQGPFSKAETYNTPAVRVVTEKGPRWLVVQDRFAPFGYLPSSLRDQPAVLIQSKEPLTTTAPPSIERENAVGSGSDSGIVHDARITLRADGSATMKLVQRYRGRYAVQLRTVLNNTPEARRRDVIEAKLLGLALPGGHLKNLKTPNLDRLDEPVELHMDVEVANFARSAQGELVLEVPFLGNLTPLVQLPERQTPLYISERVASDSTVTFTIELPKGARVTSDLSPAKIHDDTLSVSVADRIDGGRLIVERNVHIPAGRVQPDQYPAFKDVVTRADAALNRTIRLQL
jgi:hypothetical protein